MQLLALLRSIAIGEPRNVSEYVFFFLLYYNTLNIFMHQVLFFLFYSFQFLRLIIWIEAEIPENIKCKIWEKNKNKKKHSHDNLFHYPQINGKILTQIFYKSAKEVYEINHDRDISGVLKSAAIYIYIYHWQTKPISAFHYKFITSFRWPHQM